jgi:pimeloyl-ACP methyl ester carboxylesterase
MMIKWICATAAICVVAGAVAAAPPAVGRSDGAALARFYDQQPRWTRCQIAPDDEAGAQLDRAGAQCADVVVPLDYANPAGRTISVAISRLPASDTAYRIGTLVIGAGGPGEPGLHLPLPTRDAMRQTGARFDLVGVDPRFVGRSMPVDCDWPTGLFLRSPGPERAGFDRQVAFNRHLAELCWRRAADVLVHASTRNTARDMDVIRAALGERRISYLGYSYGSYLGAVYTQLFGTRTDRVVLDSAPDPRRWGLPTSLSDAARVNERALRAFARWAAARDATFGLGATAAQVLATVDRITRAAADRPLRVGDYQVDAHVVPTIIWMRVGDDRDQPRAGLADTVRILRRAATLAPADPPVEPTPELDQVLRILLTGEFSWLGSALTSVLCADVAAPQDPETYWRNIQRTRRSQPTFGPLLNNISPCAFWRRGPLEAPTTVRNSTSALIVSATGDSRTTYRGAQALGTLMTGSRLLTLRGVIAHGIYGEYGDACVDATVNAYLASGHLSRTDLICTAGNHERRS